MRCGASSAHTADCDLVASIAPMDGLAHRRAPAWIGRVAFVGAALAAYVFGGCAEGSLASGSSAPRGAEDLAAVSLVTERPAVSVPVVLWFEGFNEVMIGRAVVRGPLEARTVDVRSRVRSVRCVGTGEIRVVPPEAVAGVRCDGMRGESRLTCSDGRTLTGEFWTEETCFAGYGTGTDDAGHVFHSVFGGSQQRVETVADEALKGQVRYPRLPGVSAAGRRSESPGLITGTGFFVSWDGHLLTNHHVVQDASRIQVRLDDGELIEAELVTADRRHDLALLKVDAIRQPLPLRREHGLEKGEEVLVLGYPLLTLQGQEQKATFGRVNALSGLRGDERFAQIDAPIQPGNSGGPLLNHAGEVVGIVTSMLHPLAVLYVSGALPQNVNYALKSDLAHEMVRYELGSQWRSADPPATETELTDLISEIEPSVVIIVAE